MTLVKDPERSEQRERLEGRDLVLYSKRFANDDPTKSWYYIITTLFFLMVSFSGTIYNYHIAGQIASAVVFGLFIVKFFVIYHDYLHGAILQKSWIAKLIMTIFGILVLAPTNIWKRTHDHHHHHNSKLSNSGIGSYPLLEMKTYRKLTKSQRFIYLASRHPLTIFLGYITLFILDFNVKSIVKSPKNHWDSFVALVLHGGIGFLIYNNWGLEILLISWTLPFVIANGLGAYLFYAQHNFPGATFTDNKHWKYADAALNSTSFLVMNPAMNWFTGNIGYHHVHHINHRIPFYRLKEAMDNTPELQHPMTTTLRLKDIVACLRLKVWDDQKGKMTSL